MDYPHFLIFFLRNRHQIRKQYIDYISNFSSPDMAVSFQSSVFILYLFKIFKPKVLLDLGSGFTSFLCRLYMKNNQGVNVVSVDDDAAWLEKTILFLKKYSLDFDNCLTFENFLFSNLDIEFDFIIYDLGNMETRSCYLKLLSNFVSRERNLVFIDDLHKPGFLEEVKEYSLMHAEIFVPKKMHTVDNYGRYAGLIKNIIRNEQKNQ